MHLPQAEATQEGNIQEHQVFQWHLDSPITKCNSTEGSIMIKAGNWESSLYPISHWQECCLRPYLLVYLSLRSIPFLFATQLKNTREWDASPAMQDALSEKIIPKKLKALEKNSRTERKRKRKKKFKKKKSIHWTGYRFKPWNLICPFDHVSVFYLYYLLRSSHPFCTGLFFLELNQNV